MFQDNAEFTVAKKQTTKFLTASRKTHSILEMKRSLFILFLFSLIATAALNAQGKIHLKELAEFEAAKALALDFQKMKQPLRARELDKVSLKYTLYVDAVGVTSKVEFTVFLRADPGKENFFHAGLNLGGLKGKNIIDKFLISLGRILHKVPDTKKQFRTALELDESGRFKTVVYGEVPTGKFIKKWRKILKKEKKVLSYESKNKPEKARKLDLQINEEKDLLWSPFLVKFQGVPDNVIQYKKNSLDKKASWEDQTLPYSNQTDLFTAILNYFLTDMDEENVIPIVFVYKESDVSPAGRRKPKFVMEELTLLTLSLQGTESEDFSPCNMKLEIKGSQKVSGIFSNPIYLRKEAEGSQVPSLIYIGDIMDVKKKKVVLGKMRAYLTDISILPKELHQPEGDIK